MSIERCNISRYLASIVMMVCLFFGAIAMAADAPSTQPVGKAIAKELDNVIKEMVDTKLAKLKPPTSNPFSDDGLADMKRRIDIHAKATDWKSDAETLLAVQIGSDIQKMQGEKTAEAEQAFTAKAEQMLRDFKVEPAEVVEFLMDQNRSKALNGQRLDLYSQLMAAQLDGLVKAVKGPQKNG
jgi:hypothetical protein